MGASATDARDYDGNTKAMQLAKRGDNIPEKLYHNPILTNNYGETVAMLTKGKVGKEWYHDPTLRNNYEETVAMLAKGNVGPEWHHDPTLKDWNGRTVAMWARGTAGPEWHHDCLRNNKEMDVFKKMLQNLKKRMDKQSRCFLLLLMLLFLWIGITIQRPGTAGDEQSQCLL